MTPTSKGRLSKGRPFQDLHDRPDRVIPAEVMVQPQLVQAPVSVPTKELNSGVAGAGHLGGAAIHERT